jgi:hypothetical protein
MRKGKLAMWKLRNKNTVKVKTIEGGELVFKLYAQKNKSSSDSAHKVLIQFQRYFSFSS